jgi:hypothetical protein
LPGTDPAEALRIVLGELPDLPFLPELPARGVGADLIGRGAGLLTELPVEVYAGRWRLTGRPGRDLRRARELLERDLDTLHEQASEYEGSFKIQVAGPVDARRRARASARRPRAARPRRGREIARRSPTGCVSTSPTSPPGCHTPACCCSSTSRRCPRYWPAGSAPTAACTRTGRSGRRRRGRRSPRSSRRSGAGDRHCCASDVPFTLLREAGAAALAIDLALVTDLDPLGEAIDAGTAVVAGAADPRQPAPPSAEVANRIRDVWSRLGFPPALAAERVAVSPSCGLAGASESAALSLLAACRDAGRRLRDDAET